MATYSKQTVKIIILGDTSVGKTCLLNQYVSREFSTEYKATIGAEFLAKQADIDGKPITLQIWDTAGQERYNSLGPAYYRGAGCCVIVYDVANASTFNSIDKWRTNFLEYVEAEDTSKLPFMILGNKADLPNKAVQASAGREYANQHGLTIFKEVSARTGDGVEDAFAEIVKLALQNAGANEFRLPDSMINGATPKPQQKGTCCN